MTKPHLIAGEVVDHVEPAFAWLPCWLDDGRVVWLTLIWRWSITQRWGTHPVSFRLYTRRAVGGEA